MRSRGGLVAVDLHEDDMCRIILILDDVKAQDTWLCQRCLGIGHRGRQEILEPFAVNMDVNMNDQHVPILLQHTIAVPHDDAPGLAAVGAWLVGLARAAVLG